MSTAIEIAMVLVGCAVAGGIYRLSWVMAEIHNKWIKRDKP